MIDRAIDVAEDAGVALSINLTGGVFVNQSAAFSDFHGTGANPGGQCSADRRRVRRVAVPRRAASAMHVCTYAACEGVAMTYEHILFASGGGIARLTLNRPDRLNSFNDAMHAEVRDALDARQARMRRCACCC